MSQLRHRSGSVSLRVLVLVLLVLAGAGAWNYQRNLRREAESRAARPLAGYATADLEALAKAYREEVAAGSARYERAKGSRTTAHDQRYFDEQVREFEHVQRETTRARDAGAALSEHESSLREVEHELAQRGSAEDAWQRHLRLLTSF